MSGHIRRVSAPLFALVTVIALGFGARQALAAPASACNPPAHTTCNSQQACTEFCTVLTGYDDGHICTNGCCYCAE